MTVTDLSKKTKKELIELVISFETKIKDLESTVLILHDLEALNPLEYFPMHKVAEYVTDSISEGSLTVDKCVDVDELKAYVTRAHEPIDFDWDAGVLTEALEQTDFNIHDFSQGLLADLADITPVKTLPPGPLCAKRSICDILDLSYNATVDQILAHLSDKLT